MEDGELKEVELEEGGLEEESGDGRLPGFRKVSRRSPRKTTRMQKKKQKRTVRLLARKLGISRKRSCS